MDWLSQDVPPIWKWVAFFATIVGTGMAVWAALSARGAEEQARAAQKAASKLSHVFQHIDLLQDLEDISGLLNRGEYISVAVKAMRVRDESSV